MEVQSFPCVRYYSDGRQVLVHDHAELDALEPGHQGSPAGPWPDPPEPARPAGVADTAGARDPEMLRTRARHLRDEGKSQRDIAEALGVSPTTVRRLLETPAEEAEEPP